MYEDPLEHERHSIVGFFFFLISYTLESPREGNDNPLQYSCLNNLMDRGAWWATVQRIAELDMAEQQSTKKASFTQLCAPKCG